MGIDIQGNELAKKVVSGSFTATGNSLGLPVLEATKEHPIFINLSVYGTFSGTWSLQRSFDNGTTWNDTTKNDGTANSFTAAVENRFDEYESGVLYRISCSSYTSGTIYYRMSY